MLLRSIKVEAFKTWVNENSLLQLLGLGLELEPTPDIGLLWNLNRESESTKLDGSSDPLFAARDATKRLGVTLTKLMKIICFGGV